jgi:hypothetical protein
VYDLEETFRWIADVTVMDAFESGVLDLPDFYFTGDDYRYRFEIQAKRRFLDSLRERFNMGVRYNDRVLKWDTVIEQKASELGRYLAGQSSAPDFSEPAPCLERVDDKVLRRRILDLLLPEARKLGIAETTLHHLQGNAASEHSFRTYRKVLKRLAHVQKPLAT